PPQALLLLERVLVRRILPALARHEGLEEVVAVEELMGEVRHEGCRQQRREWREIRPEGVLAAHQIRLVPGEVSSGRRGDAQDDGPAPGEADRIAAIELAAAQLVGGLDARPRPEGALADSRDLAGREGLPDAAGVTLDDAIFHSIAPSCSGHARRWARR